jgi:hypothetical protein
MTKLLKVFLVLFLLFASFLVVAYLSVSYWLKPVIIKTLNFYNFEVENIDGLRLNRTKFSIDSLILKSNYDAIKSDIKIENLDFDIFNANLLIKKIETDLNFSLSSQNTGTDKFTLPKLPINSVRVDEILFRIKEEDDEPLINRAELRLSDLLYSDTLVANLNLYIPKINHTVALNDFRLKGNFNIKNANEISFSIDSIKAKAFKGNLKVDAFKYDLLNQTSQLKLYLNSIDLEEIFKIYPSDSVKVSGKISGVIPIDIVDKSFSVTEGKLESVKVGVINVIIPSTNIALSQVKDILANFVYEELKGLVNINKTGIANISLTIKGSNPNLNKNQSAIVNLNIEENLPALIKSLKITDEINKKYTKVK